MGRNNGKTAVIDEPEELTSDLARTSRRDGEKPYSAEVEIEGTAHLLMHKYDCAEVEAKGKAAKGSATKKTDNLESYVYRVPGSNEIGIPAANIKACFCEAAKSVQDPRSPRKSARDLVRASLFVTPDVPSLGKDKWDFEDKRGVLIQRNRITRIRPGFTTGWRLSFIVNVIQPHYVTPALLEEVVKAAGNFVGLGDFRPDYGRFTLRKFEVRDFCEAR